MNLIPILWRLSCHLVAEPANHGSVWDPFARMQYTIAGDTRIQERLPFSLEPTLSSASEEEQVLLQESLLRKLVCIDLLQRNARTHVQLEFLEAVRNSESPVGHSDFLRGLKSKGVFEDGADGNWVSPKSFFPGAFEGIDPVHHHDAERLRDHQTLSVATTATLFGLSSGDAESLLEQLVLARALRYAVGHKGSDQPARRYILRPTVRASISDKMAPRHFLMLLAQKESPEMFSVLDYQRRYALPDPETSLNELVALQELGYLVPASAAWINGWELLVDSPIPQALREIITNQLLVVFFLTFVAARIGLAMAEGPIALRRICFYAAMGCTLFLTVRLLYPDHPLSLRGAQLNLIRSLLISGLIFAAFRYVYPSKKRRGRQNPFLRWAPTFPLRGLPVLVLVLLVNAVVAWDQQIIPRIAAEQVDRHPDAVRALVLYLEIPSRLR